MISLERRYWYWEKNGGILRYSEFAPWKPQEHDHQVCNCTKAVTEKPKGRPKNVTQDFIWTQEAEDFSEFRFKDAWLTFRWDKKGHQYSVHRPKKMKGDWAFDPHAYFMFHGGAEKFLRIEVTAANDPHVERAFFGSVFLGNQIDVSKLMNGHSPSQVVDLSQIGNDDLWVHACHWGSEAMLILRESFEDNNEVARLKRAISGVAELQRQLKPFIEDTKTPVDRLHERFLCHSFVEQVIELRQLLEPFARNIQATRIFAACREVQLEAEDACKAREAAREAAECR